MLRMRITAILLAFAVAPSAVFAQASPEANWPSRPVRLLAGFPAGGSTDTVARLVTQMLGAR
jgi:tripartite-type tricarboxylate transporter receptor subunit TctC